MSLRSSRAVPILLVLSLTVLAGPAAAQSTCGTGQYTYTFTNYCSVPIWIGQTAAASNSQSYPPQYPEAGNWTLAPACTSQNAAQVCGSGQTCTNGQCTCKTDADCPGSAPCVSGLCSTSNLFCLPQTWTSGTFRPRTGCSVPSTGNLNCATGQCTPAKATNGLLDCGVGITSPTNPVTQFEVTSTAATVNYDVSIVAGYNVETQATTLGGSWVPPGVASTDPQACLSAGCTSDLNSTCPSNLQVTSGGVSGCLDPCTQCQRTAPNGSTPNATIYAALMCASAITTGSPATTTLCNGNTGGAPTYQDMYCAQNFADTTANTQASSNQGTPTAFAQSDCFPGTTFVIPTYPSGYAPPSGQGVCLYTTPPQSTIPGFNDYGWSDFPSGTTKNCSTLADGTACGGYLTGQADQGGTGYYTNAMGYTCRTVTYPISQSQTQAAHLCLPPTTSGLGTCTFDTLNQKPLYSGVGGVTNASWLTAGLQAGGGTTPYYSTFRAACGQAYAWQYDDAASGFACSSPALSGGNTLSGFAVTFCGSAAPEAARREKKK